MIDVHILTLPSTRDAWLKQAIASVDAAAARCFMPVVLHVVQGEYGHLGRSRRRGYSEGYAPWVTHVDHDDWLHEDALAEVAAALSDELDLVTTGETQMFGGRGDETPHARHHLAVYRREWLVRQPYAQFRFYPDQFLVGRAERSHHIARPLYYHRIDDNSASRKHRWEEKEEAVSEARAISDPRLLAVELMSPAQIAEEIDRELA